MKILKILSLVCLLSTSNAFSDTSKDLPKTVQMIMPYAPGGVADSQFRHFQHYLNNKGISLIGVYRPGGNNIIGMMELMKAPKDGSAISLTAAGIIVNAETQLKQPVADPLTVTGITLNAIVTNPTGKYKDLQSFENAIKTGDINFNIGYHAVGNTVLMNQYFSKLNPSVPPLRVPYKSPVESSQAVIGGHLASAVVPMSVAVPLINEGKLVLLAIAGPKSVKPIKGVVSFSKRWHDWKNTDAFMFAAPIGWSQKTTDMWLSVMEDYFKDPKTLEFYEKSYLGVEEFGPAFARYMIVNSQRQLSLIK